MQSKIFENPFEERWCWKNYGCERPEDEKMEEVIDCKGLKTL